MAAHRERDHDYGRVVVILNERWRVVVCRDGIQWILQKRDGERSGQPRWTGKSYHVGRDSLIRVCRRLCGSCDPTGLTTLENLPAKCPLPDNSKAKS